MKQAVFCIDLSKGGAGYRGFESVIAFDSTSWSNSSSSSSDQLMLGRSQLES